jgi:hypothetical protein
MGLEIKASPQLRYGRAYVVYVHGNDIKIYTASVSKRLHLTATHKSPE